MIELTDVTKRYGKVSALGGVSLSIAPGTATAIAGHNGCGKTTLLSICAGALKPTGGGVAIDGTDVAKLKDPGRVIGFLPQFDGLFDELSVKDNINFWASAARVKAGKLSENVFVNMLGLEKLLKRRAGRLSGGQKRRLSICTRLVANPATLILDEPFAGLDMFYKRELIAVLRGLREAGKTIIYSAHGVDEVEGFADRVIAMRGGEIVLDAAKPYENIGAAIFAATEV